MERIDALIQKLREQFQQQADPNVMLGTVQLLQFELTKLRSVAPRSLGTAKVAVVLPAQNNREAFSQEYRVTPEFEKYAPKPAAKAEVVIEENEPGEMRTDTRETRETLLVDKGTLSVVQKNGQLDMVFDPMREIPTLSQQAPKKAEPADAPQESINDKLRQGKTELMEVLKETPVKDLRKAIGINDRFLFINDLFRGDETMYERSIKTINNFSIYPEAEYWITRELKVKLGWPADNPSVDHFVQLVKRRFS
jgi:hypothetical protein